MADKKRFVVIGAGVAGLSAALQLVREGQDVLVIEKMPEVGGLARTFRYGDYTYDIGPHRFFSSNKEVLGFLKSVLGRDVLEILRYSAVYYCDKYHTWPLRLRSVFQMPLSVSIPAFFDLFTKSKYKKLTEPNFKNYILCKYGRTLYETFFKGYTEKFLDITPDQIHYHWAKIGVERATIDDKIQTGSISQLFRLMLMPKPKQLNFLYPPGGIDVFCKRIEQQIVEGGGKVITGVSPSAIEHEKGNITAIIAEGLRYEADVMIWTAPITTLFDLLGFDPVGLQYLALVIYNIEMEEPPLQNYQWCYFGNKEILFSRATNPAQFDNNLIPPGKGSLCMEITCKPGSEIWKNPEALNEQIVEQLVSTRSIRSKDVVRKIHTERIPDTYPVYDINYLEKLSVVREKLRVFHNLFLCGRTGLFWYNNMDHSIENAFTVVEKALGHSVETAHKRLEDPFHLGAAVGDPSCSTV
ncbi:MAG: FAD-dependent oxidoreductase [Firmicutes bacterium]|nr:FAD-dependent oxidoreductase [Bacillota bacterium]